PGMVEALELLRVAAVLPADLRASMGEGVVERAHLAVVPAHQEDVAATNHAPQVVAGSRQLRLVRHVQPAVREDALSLQRAHLGGHGANVRVYGPDTAILIQLMVAPVTVPGPIILLAWSALALHDNGPGLRWPTHGMGHVRRQEKHLAWLYHQQLAAAVRIQV